MPEAGVHGLIPRSIFVQIEKRRDEGYGHLIEKDPGGFIPGDQA
jgi:hypothetical protein